ncbi:MAG: radical SAM protein [Campylobacteraceae bacterium]|nr:radical SAM protein [Campylobacteraceae bacterium]
MKVLNTVQTICPQCYKVIEGRYVNKDGQVFLSKTCPDHGDFSTFIAPSVKEYLKWTSITTVNIPPKSPELVGANEAKEGGQCPLHCGLCHNHLQTPCCVLIEITQRCNQHCPYCFASSSSSEEDPVEAALTLDVIGKKLDRLLALGEERPFNLQFSGGEPTIRDDLLEILAIARSKGFP